MAKEKPILAGPAQSAVSGYGFLNLPTADLRATTQIGDTITRIGTAFAQGMNKAESDKQTLEADSKLLNNYAAFQTELANDPDYQSHSKKLNDFIKNQERTVVNNIRHRGARERARNQLLAYKGKWGAQVQEQAWKKEVQAIKDTAFLAIETGIDRGDMEHAEKGIQLLLDKNLVTEKGAELRRLDTRQRMADVMAERKEAASREYLRQKAKTFKTADEAIDFIESEGAKLGLKTETITWLRTAEKADRDRAKAEEEQAYKDSVEVVADEMVNGIVDGSYDVNVILMNPDLKLDDKKSLVADYKALSTATIPEQSDFDAVDRVKEAIDAYKVGKIDKDAARTVLKDNFKYLDAADRKKYRNELYEEGDSNYNSRRSDGRFFLKNALMTDTTALGMRIPAGKEEIQNYENASIEMDNLLDRYRISGKWPSNKEFYAEIQVIINKVKAPGYEQNPIGKAVRKGFESAVIADKIRQGMGVRKGAATGAFRPDPKRSGQPLVVFKLDADGKEVVQGLQLANGAVLPVNGEYKDNKGKIFVFRGVNRDGSLKWEEK